MTPALRLRFVVACSAAHAFHTWTARTSTWWPLDHTVTRVPGTGVVIEPRVGGRILELPPTAEAVEWGQVTVWDPPRRLGYRWYIGGTSDDATDVTVAFTELEDGATQVDIEHSGWDRLGTSAAARRDANRAGWSGLLPHFVSACAAGTGNDLAPTKQETP